MSYGAAGRCSHGAKCAVPRQEEAPLCRHRAEVWTEKRSQKMCAVKLIHASPNQLLSIGC